jgi:hypothetical protein
VGVEEEEGRLMRVQEIHDMLQAAAEAVGRGECTVDDLLDTVSTLRISYSDEWDALGLFAAAALLVTPAFHAFLSKQWDVLRDPAQHAQSIAAWKVLLEPADPPSCPLPPSEIRAIFNGLLMRSVVPVACLQLKRWDAASQAAIAVQLMQHWSTILSDTCCSFIIDNALLPPIIFESGYGVETREFAASLRPAAWLAGPGTVIAAVTTAVLLALAGAAGAGYAFSFLDALLLGTVVSATSNGNETNALFTTASELQRIAP